MTHFFPYDEMTWPEVDALDRSTPLVFPLGDGYTQKQISGALGSPPHIGMLPPLPFGWTGSGLEVEPALLAPVLHNLAEGLREDGFSRVHILAPLGVDLDLPGLVHLPVSAPQPAPPLPAEGEQGKVVLVPIGHTEQHGFHSPMSTDTLIIEAIARGAAAAVPERAVALPVMPYGVSTHRTSFTGTLSAGGRAFEDFWLGAIDALVRRGFDRFYLLSGHGGNCSFLVNVVKYAGERHRRIFCATAFLYLSGAEGVAALEEHRSSPTGGMGHACELETSLLLHLRPDLVHMERAVDEMDFVSTPNYYMDWVEGGALVANPPWDDDTVTGAYGAGSQATAEKGRLWLEAAVAEKAGHIAEIHEQHTRRETRRVSGFGEWGKT